MARKDSTRQEVIGLQKKLFESLQRELKSTLGKMPAVLCEYEKEYLKDLKVATKKLKLISKDELINTVRKTDVTFIADFHTYDQAQKSAFQIIRESTRKSETWFIGLEMISSQFQPLLDRFQQGKLNLEEFHQEINYETEWGFPWENYAHLFDWARENETPLIALNRPKELHLSKEDLDLDERDLWAAGIITDTLKKAALSQPAQMIVLYGEYHIGSQHLPRHLEKISSTDSQPPLSWISIHQNQESLYWKLKKTFEEMQNQAVWVNPNSYCIFSDTPAAKLQSLLSWAEGDPDLI